jgi:hypothetical protein
MAMRAQFQDYFLDETAAATYEVFALKFGFPQLLKSTQFVVIEDIGSTPVAITFENDDIPELGVAIDTWVQVRLDTTEYFVNPDRSKSLGIPGRASPYPRSNTFYPSFKLKPDIYVLPGQNWEILLTKAETFDYEQVGCYVKYTLYDGMDAMMANKLLELGFTITPRNIDWFKRTIIENGGRIPDKFTYQGGDYYRK